MNKKDKEKNNRKSSTYDIYVGHVPKDIQEDKLRQNFSAFGEVVDVLCRYGNGSYGYAIVKFKQKKDADTVLKEVHKIQVDGHEMEVKNGKRNNNSSETESGFLQPRCMSFVEPKAYQVDGVVCLNPNVQPRDPQYNHFQENERNNQQSPVLIEVMCTSVQDAVTFYGCPIFRCEELQSLSMKLNSICPNLERILRKPRLRKVYGALYLSDNSWYRCIVIQCAVPSRPGLCIVQYIDYGNVGEVTYMEIVDLPEPIKNIPPLAVKCSLSNLICNPDSNCDVSYLHHLVNQRMSLSAYSVWGVPEYQVMKCSCNGIDVISELVRNGFAVYKSQKLPVKSPPPGRSEKTQSKNQDQQKAKKPGKKTNSKNPGSKNLCNGVEKHVNGNSCCSVKSLKSSAPDDIQRISSPDCVPKKIIQRGSHINNFENHHIGKNKGGESVNQLLKLDCMVSNLKLVNNVRLLVSPTSDDNLIRNSVQLLLSDLNTNIVDEVKNEVEEAYKKYSTALKELKLCSDQALLSGLKEQKEMLRNELHEKLKKYFMSFDVSLFEKRKTIQKMITDLESNSNGWMNVYLPSQPSTIEDLLDQYNKEKENRWNVIGRARQHTNDKHNNFFEFLDDFKKECYLYMFEESSEESYQLKNVEGRKGSWALKFEETVSELGSALDEEMNTCTGYIGKSHLSVIQCILDRLEIPKEKIDAECEQYQKYKLLYDELSCCSELQASFPDLASKLDKIKSDISKYSTYEGNELHENLLKIHKDLLKEDVLLESLAKAAAQHFPELVVEYPQLNLAEYQKNCHLVKQNWMDIFFPFYEECSRVESSYISKFVDDPVVVKEFEVLDKAEVSSLIKKGVVWNEIHCSSLAKIKAFFRKDENTVCAIIPSIWKNFYDSPLPVPVDSKLACQILHQVLNSLQSIHSRGIAHGAVHPLAILRNEGQICLDFNFDHRYIQNKLCIKGLNFQVPNGEDACKSADMYGFGCLVLWVLFPNLSFTPNEQGVPNLSAFQSIVEEFLSAKDFAALSALLNVNPDLRPSSGKLLSSGFLKSVRVIPEPMQ